MNLAREWFACASISSGIYGNVVIVAGGKTDGGFTASTEFYRDKKWASGPNLPKGIGYAALVGGDGKKAAAFFVGGYSIDREPLSSIYMLTANLNWWVEKKKKLSLARSGHSTLNVPDALIGCESQGRQSIFEIGLK